MNTSSYLRLLRSSVLAGICIGIAGFGFLAEKSIVGAVLFAFGLLTVVHYGLKLYTGTAGFIRKGELGNLLLILIGNILGCLAVALIARCSPMPLQATAQGVLEARLATGPLRGGVLAIGCGFIMTTAVTFGRQGKNLPLLFGVPLFIMCGFPHCIADAFYYLCVPLDFWARHWTGILAFYVAIVVGNFIGCNLYRTLLPSAE
ncbi:MAG: formate/nitrite transporter family protein [Bacteroidaceae bacterium]|nr:formate/nitrite transporter family protein [Bacteroidaceae bacterium]